MNRCFDSRLIYCLSLCWLVLTACGDANFSGSNTSDDKKGKPGPGDEDQTLGYALSWDWGCQTAANKIEDDGHTITLHGPGPHNIDKMKANGAVVSFKGEACKASKTPRDVVFVIDVSGSMNSGSGRGTDPILSGTCGRMDALEKVLSIIKESGAARFGVVTFGSNVKQASTGLFADKAELYADLLAQSSFSSIQKLICDGDDNTNYDAGLGGAETILNDNKVSGHLREVYFISDGVPEPASSNGKVIASRLRADTTIATVMVGGSDDSVLRDSIASKDKFGEPLHARSAHSSGLAQVLSTLSSNRIVGAEIRYGAKGNTGKPIDFMSKISGSSFSFKGFTINISDAPDNLAVEFRYRDRFGGEQTSVGELIWKDAP